MLTGVIYTATTPGYDKFREIPPEEGITVEHRQPPKWLEPSKRSRTLWNRENKILFPPKGDHWSLYLDGSIIPKVPIKALVEEWLSPEVDIAMFRHPSRTCVYDEVDACVKRGKITQEEGKAARDHLERNGFPRGQELWASGIIARRTHVNSVQDTVCPEWWQLTKWIPRDQIWFPLVIWQMRVPDRRIKTIDADIFNNKWLSYRRHGT